jgi:aryl-alcohol dehydrogenase-like predicted oxidoreductase
LHFGVVPHSSLAAATVSTAGHTSHTVRCSAAGVIAIAWTVHNSAVTPAIVGERNAKQIEGVIPAMNFRLPEAEYAEINEFLKANL